MLLMVIDAELLLVSVMTFCPPLFPIATEAQLWLVGETVTAARLSWEKEQAGIQKEGNATHENDLK